MLRGTYSHVSPAGKFFILIVLFLSLLLLSSILGIVAMVPFLGMETLQILSNPDYSDSAVVSAMKAMQFVNMAGGILLPALLFLWLCDPEVNNKDKYWSKQNVTLMLASVGLIILSQPIIGISADINSRLQLPQSLSSIETWMRNAEKQGELITNAFLATTSLGGLMVNILLIAVLPAFAEELLFRGVIARLFNKWTGSVHVAVILSAAIFAAVHMQFLGFVPRFLLGMALGYLFFWSGGLWLPVIAHFTNNFLAVIFEFLYRKGVVTTNAENLGTNPPLWWAASSVILVAVTLYFIYKTSIRTTDNRGRI